VFRSIQLQSALWLFVIAAALAPARAADAADSAVPLPPSFPQSDYTPFGYIDNPYHSAVFNRSGVIRTVPPLGFGFWARRLPWPYGGGALRRVNYLSFLHLSMNVGGVRFHTAEDFRSRGVELVSRYHTKTMTSYDWSFRGASFSAKYFLAGENSLVCILEMHNAAEESKTLTVHASNIYGFPEEKWWGSDGVAASYNEDFDAGVAKIWAYGDIFAVGADAPGAAHKATSSREEWNRWITESDLSSSEGASVHFPGGMYTVQSYQVELDAGESRTLRIGLTRGPNEDATVRAMRAALNEADETLARQLAADEDFYRNAPLLTGDWPEAWKHGWIYDFETLRMTIRPPLGIYKHPWDGMQIFTPRQVLGETMLDTMALSYADVELAKEVIYGTFAGSPADNIPCTREDGSVNMICADGSEAGTAPTWGYPFHMIRAIYLRDADDQWITDLYPHLKAFIEWWLENRTGEEGWFHSKCSWESGQDGSKRFLVPSDDPGAVADFVRTVDIEAAMAEAMKNMVLFAEIAGRPEDREMWRKMAEHRIKTTRAMYVDGWFRDFDARTNEPIILEDYWDIMMLAPLTTGIATPEQMERVKPKFRYFKENPEYWLEWPSFMFPFAEAAWNAGMREFIAGVVAGTGNRIYPRLDARRTKPTEPFESTLPQEYDYRIPGVANEFWPIDETENPGNAENYGWGATLPTLVIRNIIGFRELEDPAKNAFTLAPALPEDFAQPGRRYGITNLHFRGSRSAVTYEVQEGGKLSVRLETEAPALERVEVTGEEGQTLARSEGEAGKAVAEFGAANGGLYTVRVETVAAVNP